MDNYALVRNNAQVASKVTVLLDPSEFERLDSYCERRGFKKSTLLARLVRDYLDNEGFHIQSQLHLGDQNEGAGGTKWQ